MIAILDTDGLRLVVWGLGRTEASARREAKRQQGYEETDHERVVQVGAERAREIRLGAVGADDLVPKKGRPLSAGAPRSVELRVRLTPDEMAEVQRRSGVKPVSEYVRARLGLA